MLKHPNRRRSGFMQPMRESPALEAEVLILGISVTGVHENCLKLLRSSPDGLTVSFDFLLQRQQAQNAFIMLQ